MYVCLVKRTNFFSILPIDGAFSVPVARIEYTALIERTGEYLTSSRLVLVVSKTNPVLHPQN